MRGNLAVLAGRERCPRDDQHTPRPTFSKKLRFLDWAREQERTHRLTQCEGCGLYVIWVPLEGSAVLA